MSQFKELEKKVSAHLKKMGLVWIGNKYRELIFGFNSEDGKMRKSAQLLNGGG